MCYEITVTQFTKMLNNLSRILDKADTFSQNKKIDTEVLLNSRLIADQFNLIKQVQIACDVAKIGAAKLCGKEAPKNEDNEKTLSDLKARISSTTNYLATLSKKDFDGAQERQITQPRWEGKYLSGFEYFVEHVVPNVYFHVTTTYAILRSNGVEIGKKDYLGEMPFKK